MDGHMQKVSKIGSHWATARYGQPRRSRGFYESWFIRANHPSKSQAIWVRYTVFEASDPDQLTEGELWACYFDGDTDTIIQATSQVPVDQCFFSANDLRVIIADATLSLSQANGACRSSGHQIAWALDMSGNEAPLFLLPEKLYQSGFPKAKSLVVQPGTMFKGNITVDDTQFDISSWRGSINHNWGIQHTEKYHWGQVAGFDNDPDAFLEVATATLGKDRPWGMSLSPIVLRHGGRQYCFNSPLRSFLNDSSQGESFWTFGAKADGVRLYGEIHAPDKYFTAFKYRNPPGGHKLCLNTKIGRCDLWLDLPSGEKKHLYSASGAAWEILDDL